MCLFIFLLILWDLHTMCFDYIHPHLSIWLLWYLQLHPKFQCSFKIKQSTKSCLCGSYTPKCGIIHWNIVDILKAQIFKENWHVLSQKPSSIYSLSIRGVGSWIPIRSMLLGRVLLTQSCEGSVKQVLNPTRKWLVIILYWFCVSMWYNLESAERKEY